MNRDGIHRLAQLAAMKRDVDLNELSRMSVRMNALQAEINDLRAQTRAREENLTIDPARMTGVDVVWQRWVDITITRHQARMAELALARELFLDRARLSFGRADVLSKLEQKQKQKQPRHED